MSNTVIVHKGRTMSLPVELGYDITGETFTSEIRTQPDQDAVLIATWTVSVVNATTGSLLLEMDDLVTGQVAEDRGYMDVRRLSGGEPLAVWDRPLEVEFRGTVTAS